MVTLGNESETGPAATLSEPAAGGFDFGVLRELRRSTGLSLRAVSARCGVSVPAISKLERNRSGVELDTLHRLARVYGISASELVALAEGRTAARAEADAYQHDGFRFRRVAYGNASLFYATAPAGVRLKTPEMHGDDYEICWVLAGMVRLALPREIHRLGAGDALQFDGVLPHTYEVEKRCRLVLAHLAKPKRF